MEQQWITIFNIIVGIGLLLYLLRCWQRGFAFRCCLKRMHTG